MTEQTNTPVNTSKPERSANYVISRLSYDCLISSTKSFVHNFNSLSDEEKLEFKSLVTYVKQLEKCLPSKQNRQVSKPRRVVQIVESSVPTTVPLVEEKVVEPVKNKNAKRTKKVETLKEVSPTAVAAAVAVAEVAAEVTVPQTTPEEVKKPAAKKSTQSKTK
jgi:hypothetical protein